jgi:polygalacturonase
MKTKTRLSIIAVMLCAFACCLFLINAQISASSAKTEATQTQNVNAAGGYDVKAFGARGDGKTLDTPSINKAIDAAASAGGGTVRFPAGTYLCFSIHLKSNVALYLDHGATILAADPKETKGGYDLPEPNDEWDMYQDFGHSHWQNSLMWGTGLENVSILGSGLINGKGLTRRGPRPRRPVQAGDRPTTLGGGQTGVRQESPVGEDDPASEMNGLGNKAISLKNCRGVTIRDISILNGGHFAILATGVDNMTIDNIKIDTNRDGIDVDACRNVRISNTSVNSPNDDAIVLKSSYGLGFARATENVTITGCFVSGYDIGSLLDATYKRNVTEAPDHDGATGRIKFGTESNGGFKNITISDIVFDHCRGLALETVDGALLEDVSISNITMRDVQNSPIFLRLGSRMRGPAGIPIGQLRRINISNIVAYNADPRYASIINGLPGHDIEDVKLSNIRIFYQGGGTREQAALVPKEQEKNYPEPSMFGTLPAYGFFIRHARGIELNNVEVSFMKDEARPAFVLEDVKNVDFFHVKAQKAEGVATFVLRNVSDFSVQQSRPVADMRLERVEQKNF